MKDLADAVAMIVFMLLVASTCDGPNGVDAMDAVIERLQCGAKP